MKHVVIQRSPHAGSDFFNYKKFHSIIKMAVVDANYNFIWIWKNSQLKLGMSTDRLHLPQPEPFPGDTADIPFFLIGDDTFALEEFLMKPYGHLNLMHEEPHC